MDYYRDAMSHFGKDRVFAVFSDDIAWCKANLSSGNFIFVEGQHNFEDLFLMTLCKDHIIANSTFSWWGAWLNPSPGKTILAPARWSHLDTRDLIPPSWIEVPC
jgi:hypothetical protein